ncbi:MAG: hypothetical protein AAF353_08515 [Pseudomonadota bacterium]
MKKVTTVLLALYLLAGCSSGGGIEAGAGGEGTTTTNSGLVLASSVSPDGSFSVDAIIDICELGSVDGEGNVTEPTTESGLTTTPGTFTITVLDATDLTGGLFPRGITLDRYTVSYTGRRAGTPRLTTRTFSQTVSILSGNGTTTAPVILLDLDTLIREFVPQTSGSVVTYTVTVTFFGRDLNGEPLRLVASTFLEVGNFDRC